MSVLVGRQPICDRNLDIYGYELLFCPRERGVNFADVDADVATATVALDTLVGIGTENLVGNSRAFFNMTRNFLVDRYYQVLPAGRVVLEILEDIAIDEPVLAAIRNARSEGYQIALDDFVYRPELEPLIELADIVKVETLGMSQQDVLRHAELLGGRDLLLLAEKVETYEQFEFCRDAGYDLFQGFFFCRPQVVRKRKNASSRLALMRVMSKLMDPVISFREVEEIISSDVSFCYAILRTVNSSMFSLPRRVDSIHHALVLLGVQQVRTFAAVMMMASSGDGKPTSLLTTALERAKCCELLAGSGRAEDAMRYFTVGLFSVLDAITDQPMDELLASLPLSDDVRAAILRLEGRAGLALKATICCERAAFDEMLGSGFDPDILQSCYLRALDWAHHLRVRMLESGTQDPAHAT